MTQGKLPDGLGAAFDVATARALGVSRGRLRSGDLRAPFHGVRVAAGGSAPAPPPDESPWDRQRRERVTRAREYAPRLHSGHFFSHQTAASIWGAPLPLELVGGAPASGDDLALHVCARGDVPLPRAAGVVGHRVRESMISTQRRDGLVVASPASTWASLGALPVSHLVALGDYFCRRWRAGHGRPQPDRLPLATVRELRAALEAGRRLGAKRLRGALELIREDAWSPRESQLRCLIVGAGLPEPELNVDVFDDHGRFLGCVDLGYPDRRVAVEYHGFVHARQWSRDVERAAALRAAGWTVIEVTAESLSSPAALLRRIRDALSR